MAYQKMTYRIKQQFTQTRNWSKYHNEAVCINIIRLRIDQPIQKPQISASVLLIFYTKSVFILLYKNLVFQELFKFLINQLYKATSHIHYNMASNVRSFILRYFRWIITPFTISFEESLVFVGWCKLASYINNNILGNIKYLNVYNIWGHRLRCLSIIYGVYFHWITC